jgi:polyphosphate kinase
MNAEQKAAAHAHFASTVFTALTPLAIDPGHPFPHLRNKSLNVAVLLRRKTRKRKRNPNPVELQQSSLAVVQLPSVLGRLVPLPSTDGRVFTMLGDLIAAYVGDLFPGLTVEQTAAFRVTRNWDLNIDEEDSEDLLETIEEELLRRERGGAVRLEIYANASPQIEAILTEALQLGPADVYRVDGPLHLTDLGALADGDARPELRVEPLQPHLPQIVRDAESMFSLINSRDLLLHHPYESFDPVVRFMEEAADDPNVLAIKQTLYRISGDSPIARALQRAAQKGKQVTVLIELKARLDEATNIAWARSLEDHGVHVVYGLLGLKTHCKMLLVVRREGNANRRYVHLGTGNYNPQTARQYTDLSLLTTRNEIADDVAALFNLLTGISDPPAWKRLAVAPFNLEKRILELIERETEFARKGEPARIVAKMNALVGPVVIGALYEASQAGVEIELLVRGICCLRPGVPDVSSRIKVVSVVDRFLEHCRVFAFGQGERTEVFLSSADWMPRNFGRRVEVMFPVEDPALKARVLEEVLGVGINDNVKACQLDADGNYHRVESNGTPLRSQALLLEQARRGGIVKTPTQLIRHLAAPETPGDPLRVAKIPPS